MKIVATARRVSFDYFILTTYEAGIVLEGCEVKSIRQGNVSINESFISIDKDMQIFIKNMYIKKYDKISTDTLIDEKRNRKLLLSKHEIQKIFNSIREKGFTCVPVKVYFKNQFVKIEIAVAKGKHTYDKKQTLMEKDIQRETLRTIKNYSR